MASEGSPRQTRSGRTRSEAGGGGGGGGSQQQQQNQAAAAPSQSRGASAATRSASRRTNNNNAAPASTAAAAARAPSARSGRTRSGAAAAAATATASDAGVAGASPAATPANAAARRRGNGRGTAAAANGNTPFPNPASRSRGAIGTVSAVRRRRSISTGFPADSASLGASLDRGSLPDGDGGGNAGNTNGTNNNNTSGGGGGNTATRGAATAGAGATTDNGALPGGGGAAAAAAGAHTYVWGTNIDIASISRRLRRFLTAAPAPDGAAKYVRLLQQLAADGDAVLNVDAADVAAFDATLYSQLLKFPSEVITLLDDEARHVVAGLTGADPADVNVSSKPFNLAEVKVIRDLNPSDVNQLVSVRGMLTRASPVIPDLRVACFRCDACGAEEHAYNDRGRIEEPAGCASCGARWTARLLHNRSGFFDKQVVKVQEAPDAIPEGETPHSATLLAFDDAVDAARPGDRVVVTGIYKAVPLRLNPRVSTLRAVYKAHIDVVHVQVEGGGASALLAAAAAAAPTTNIDGISESAEDASARVARLRALSASPDLYERLLASVAPSIWQLDDVKRGVLAQLFGGCSKTFSGGRARGEINVLLVGDPGVSKSQLLSYVHKLAPRGIYTSGRGSSAVGLTAYVARDPETREMVLESGALVLSDGGICCIDEFDKMADAARAMLHEVMEQQTVSVAKAGIVASLNARTSVLASANPVGSRYNPRLSVVDNIGLPPSLVSRFDLIYLVLDKADEAADRTLARHLISLHHAVPPPAPAALIPISLLRDYVAYARAHCHPVLSDDAARALTEGYLSLRRLGAARRAISATPRQLESLIRLSEARARMRLSDVVTREDAAEALRLVRVALQQSATDPTTGSLDLDLLQTGVSAAARAAGVKLAPAVRAALQAVAAGGEGGAAGISGGLSVDELAAALSRGGAGGSANAAAAAAAAVAAVAADPAAIAVAAAGSTAITAAHVRAALRELGDEVVMGGAAGDVARLATRGGGGGGGGAAAGGSGSAR